jgi:hypothetical protein
MMSHKPRTLDNYVVKICLWPNRYADGPDAVDLAQNVINAFDI